MTQLEALRSILRVTRDHDILLRVEAMCEDLALCIKHDIEQSISKTTLDCLLKLNKKILDLTDQILHS